MFRLLFQFFPSISIYLVTTLIIPSKCISTTLTSIEHDNDDEDSDEEELGMSLALTIHPSLLKTTTPSPATPTNIIILILFFAMIIGIIVFLVYRIRLKTMKKTKNDKRNFNDQSSPESTQSANRTSLWSNTGDFIKENLNAV